MEARQSEGDGVDSQLSVFLSMTSPHWANMFYLVLSSTDRFQFCDGSLIQRCEMARVEVRSATVRLVTSLVSDQSEGRRMALAAYTSEDRRQKRMLRSIV